MARRTDARRIRNYFKKHPNATPREVVTALGVNIANVYYVRKTLRSKQPIDLSAAGSPIEGSWVTPVKQRLLSAADIDRIRAGKEVDMVNSPPHYKVGGMETIDFIEAKQLNYNLGNVVKYITRADHKGNRIEDLKKAKWYLEREILSQHI